VPLTTIAVDGSGKGCAVVGDARGGLTLISLSGRQDFFRVPNAHRGHVQVSFESGDLTSDSAGDLTSDSAGDLTGNLTGGHVQDVWMFGEGSSVVAYTADSSRDSGIIRR